MNSPISELTWVETVGTLSGAKISIPSHCGEILTPHMQPYCSRCGRRWDLDEVGLELDRRNIDVPHSPVSQ